MKLFVKKMYVSYGGGGDVFLFCVENEVSPPDNVFVTDASN